MNSIVEAIDPSAPPIEAVLEALVKSYPSARQPVEDQFYAVHAAPRSPVDPPGQLATGARINYVLDNLTAAESRVVELRSLGLSVAHIAASTGLSSTTIRRILCSEMVRAEIMDIAVRRSAIAEGLSVHLAELGPTAIDIYHDILTSETVDLRLKAKVAGDLLDRIGVSRQTRTVMSVDQGYVSDDRAYLQEQAKKLAILSGVMVDMRPELAAEETGG